MLLGTVFRPIIQQIVKYLCQKGFIVSTYRSRLDDPKYLVRPVVVRRMVADQEEEEADEADDQHAKLQLTRRDDDEADFLGIVDDRPVLHDADDEEGHRVEQGDYLLVDEDEPERVQAEGYEHDKEAERGV